MRQFNFVVIFVICLGVALFAMQNSSAVTVTVAPGIQFQAPLVVQLLASLGLGASIAWLFSVWTKAQFVTEARQMHQEMEGKDARIAELTDMMVEMESNFKQLPPTKRAEPSEAEMTEEERVKAIEEEAANRMTA
ncbi:MAG: lipopolysaccharide assembly protein LapA domain-containing protein [Cyanobacteria bacterium J06639_1]